MDGSGRGRCAIAMCTMFSFSFEDVIVDLRMRCWIDLSFGAVDGISVWFYFEEGCTILLILNGVFSEYSMFSCMKCDHFSGVLSRIGSIHL